MSRKFTTRSYRRRKTRGSDSAPMITAAFVCVAVMVAFFWAASGLQKTNDQQRTVSTSTPTLIPNISVAPPPPLPRLVSVDRLVNPTRAETPRPVDRSLEVVPRAEIQRSTEIVGQEAMPSSVEVSSPEVNTVVPSAPWIQPAANSPAKHVFSDTDIPCVVGSFAFPSTVKGCPLIVCDYKIPHDGQGRPIATAADIVAVFPYPTENNATQGTASALALRWGFTILSLRFPGMDKESGDDESTFYYFPQSGSGQAYRTAVLKVREMCGFPVRKLLVTGLSGGGSAAYQYANAFPDEVESVAQEAARVFPFPIKFRGPVLITHGERDYVTSKVLEYSAALSTAHANFTRMTFRPNWGQRGQGSLWTHGQPGGPIILYAWLADIANARMANRGTLPDFSTWKSVDGKILPGPLSIATWRKMAPSSKVIASRAGEVTVMYPAQSMNPTAVIFLISNEFTESEEECLFDGDYFADSGKIAIVSASEDAARDAWNELGANEKRLPSIVIYYGTDKNVKKIIDSTKGSNVGVLVCGKPSAGSSATATRGSSTSFMVFWPDDRMQPNIPKGYSLNQYRPGKSPGLNHRSRIEAMEQCFDKLILPKK